MPEKISIYTTLAGLLNVENYSFGGEFVDGLARKFRDLLNAGSYGQAELVVSFPPFFPTFFLLICVSFHAYSWIVHVSVFAQLFSFAWSGTVSTATSSASPAWSCSWKFCWKPLTTKTSHKYLNRNAFAVEIWSFFCFSHEKSEIFADTVRLVCLRGAVLHAVDWRTYERSPTGRAAKTPGGSAVVYHTEKEDSRCGFADHQVGRSVAARRCMLFHVVI